MSKDEADGKMIEPLPTGLCRCRLPAHLAHRGTKSSPRFAILANRRIEPMIEILRSGNFLTRARLRVYPLILIIGYALSLGFMFATSQGGMDQFGRPLGTDFSEVYAAGVFVRAGEPAKPFDNPAHQAMQERLFGADTPFYSWGYPPYFLAFAGLLAFLPYLGALIFWQGATLLGYLAAIRRIAPFEQALPLALAFPAVYVNLAHGQNGFLTAGLMAGGLVLLDERPVLAGALLGCLVYKPQFCLLLPIALIAGCRWRSVLCAALTVLVMTLATLVAFGGETWMAFLNSLPFSREVVVEQGATGFEKFQTVFGAVRLLGGSIPFAYALQSASTLASAAVIAILWWNDADRRLASAALMGASLLATPYALDYDMMVLGPAIAFFASYGLEHGFRPFEKSVLALAWCAPILARAVAEHAHIPVGVICVMLLFATIAARASRGSSLAFSAARR
jgi:alpha-1,2-mannosyltransferase